MLRHKEQPQDLVSREPSQLDLDSIYVEPAGFTQHVEDYAEQQGLAVPGEALREAPTVSLREDELSSFTVANHYYSQTGQISKDRIGESEEVGASVDTVVQKIADFLHHLTENYNEYYQTMGDLSTIWSEFNTVRDQLMELMQETIILDTTYNGVYSELSILVPQGRELLAKKNAIIEHDEAYKLQTEEIIGNQQTTVSDKMLALEQQTVVTMERGKIISDLERVCTKKFEADVNLEAANAAELRQRALFASIKTTIEGLARRHDATLDRYYELYRMLTGVTVEGFEGSGRRTPARHDIGARIIQSLDALHALPTLDDSERTAPQNVTQLPGRNWNTERSA